MGTPDPRVDAYIGQQADFARPILTHIRAMVHAGCADADEAIKWGFPHFVYKGKNLASMAAFKAHATLGFWYGDKAKETGSDNRAMGQFGRLTSLADLPPDSELADLIAQSMALIESGAKPEMFRNRKARAPIDVPPELQSAIDANAAASSVWADFSPGKKRDYAEWIVEARRDDTRAKRIAQAVEWIAEGKERHWKYKNC